MDRNRIPIVVGIAAEPSACGADRSRIREIITGLRRQVPHSEILLLVSLSSDEQLSFAAEADQVYVVPPEEGAAYIESHSHLLLSPEGNVRETLDAESLLRIDEFNELARGGVTDEDYLLPKEAERDPVLLHFKRVYHNADSLSLSAARVYRYILMLLAAAGTALTLAFLLYDEAELYWMILVCGGMLAASWFLQKAAARTDCHRRYIEYRALAEWLRVQAFLRYAGTSLHAVDLLTWSQRDETAWIVAALQAMEIGPPPADVHEIRGCWVEDQRNYHHKAIRKSALNMKKSDRVVTAAILISITLYLSAVGVELLCGGLLFTPVAKLPDLELWRTLLKIALGALSAATLFISGYFGKQSLPRIYSDHCKMEQFYARMSERLLREGQTDELLSELAREELIENGNWVSYERDNTPDLSI